MATVSVPADFFRGELRVYGDWREAFARELLQNSLDARPSRIDVSFSATADGHGQVRFYDDGTGISEQTLTDVFFALGRTTKTAPGSIGGFGRARIILCFAQRSYRIRTHHLLVTGSGGDYTITHTPDYLPGTEFSIDLIDDDADEVRRCFERLLRRCTLAVPVFLDGSRAPGRRIPTRATRILRDEGGQAWARIFVDPNAGGVLDVRVSGLVMFNRWLNSDDRIVVELLPGRAREVLSASRDTLHTDFKDQLDQFIVDLSQNRRAALKADEVPLTVQVHGGGFLTSTPTPSTRAANSTLFPEADARECAEDEAALAQLSVDTPRRIVSPSTHPMTTTRRGGAESLGFDVFLLADCTDTRVKRLRRDWDPARWDETRGTRRRSLLLAWKAAVGVCVETLLTLEPNLGHVSWTVGWVFDTDVAALHRTSRSGHILALNPVGNDERTRYQLSSRTSRTQLLAEAAHEVAHLVHPQHDEAFAGMLTRLYGALDQNGADRVIRRADSHTV